MWSRNVVCGNDYKKTPTGNLRGPTPENLIKQVIIYGQLVGEEHLIEEISKYNLMFIIFSVFFFLIY